MNGRIPSISVKNAATTEQSPCQLFGISEGQRHLETYSCTLSSDLRRFTSPGSIKIWRTFISFTSRNPTNPNTTTLAVCSSLFPSSFPSSLPLPSSPPPFLPSSLPLLFFLSSPLSLPLLCLLLFPSLSLPFLFRPPSSLPLLFLLLPPLPPPFPSLSSSVLLPPSPSPS